MRYRVLTALLALPVCVASCDMELGQGIVDLPPAQGAGVDPNHGAGSSLPPATKSAIPADAGNATPWLKTVGNHLQTPDGKVWAGRGVSVHDTRNCEACTFDQPNVAEAKRRIDAAVDVWHATFVRVLLESYAQSQGRVQYKNILDDPNYFQDVVDIVRHVGTKPNVYVLLSLWVDPSFDSHGWPTDTTAKEWQQFAQTFANDSYVLYAIANEPQSNTDGALDEQVWTGMNNAVQAIRDVEDANKTPHHIVSVQATRGWARFLDYYVTNPITAAGGDNIIYETHVYNPQSDFNKIFVEPAQTLPVVIAEFGPVQVPGVSNMSAADTVALMNQAEKLQIPYIAWTFHQNCGPVSLLQVTVQGCGVGMPLTPDVWGKSIQSRLAKPPVH